MLVTTKELLRLADTKNKAVGAFNISGLETLQAVLGAAEELNEPVILQFAQGHEVDNVISLDVIGPIMVHMAKCASIPVAVHLDHGVDLSYLEKALKMGFTSIMYDGSMLPVDENIANTIIAVKLAAQYGATVEAEIGEMAGIRVNDKKEKENIQLVASGYTDPIVAKDFVKQTGVDCLACAFGSVHGVYATEPSLDFNLLANLNQNVGVPIVMHGGSGISEEDYDKLIELGVRKVNYYTYMAKSGAESVKEKINNVDYFHDISNIAINGMKQDILKAIHTFKHERELG